MSKKPLLMTALILIAVIVAFLYLAGYFGNNSTTPPANIDEIRSNILTNLGMEREDSDYSYTVKEGDTLDSLAAEYELSKNSIVWSNSLESEELTVGQTLYIPPADGILVTVSEGDTVESLAEKYEANQQDIKDFNWLDYPFTLKVGELLFIPDGVL